MATIGTFTTGNAAPLTVGHEHIVVTLETKVFWGGEYKGVRLTLTPEVAEAVETAIRVARRKAERA